MPSVKTNRSRLAKERRNKRVRTYARSRVAAARAEMDGDATPDQINAALKAAVKALDQAAAKGVIHKNNAARRKARLMARLNSRQSDNG